ncbi:major facilitator superfamily domain-containing protein [Aspergillus aurantiobrunneus]
MASRAAALPGSHHHRARGDGPQKRVDELVRKYRRPNDPSPIMLDIFNNPEAYSILIGALRRQVSLAKCRSQDFEDCQVTIYDRALLILTNYGESATDPRALELYLTEFLGIVPIAPIADGMEAVSRHLNLQNVLEEVEATHKRHETAPPTKEYKREEEETSSPFDIDVEYARHFPDDPHGYEEGPKPTITMAKQAYKLDVRVTRLLDVYHQAKKDYFTTKERDGVDSLPAVRFLRDSAENTLRYLRTNGLSDNRFVPDLERTFIIARDKTAQILGGRKRHFDEDNRGKKRPETCVIAVFVEMAYIRPSLAGPASIESSGSSTSNVQYTPVSDRSVDGQQSRNLGGSLKLQTDFSAAQDQFSEDDVDEYNYNDEARPKFSRPRVPKYTPAEEQHIVRKFDRRLVPFLALLYLLSFLDRSNIGNAKIAGLMDDLNLSSSQYEWLLTAFYITYILFEWMTLLYRVFPAHVYISLCVCGWGLVASFQSLASSFGAMVILRAVLGITEAAFGPGVPFYLSLFYKREELAFRTGLFISAAPLASSFASSLAWLIVKSSSDGPIAPWRTLFLVEGFPSVIVAVFAWFMIPDSPGSSAFLEPQQRMVAQLRMRDGGRPDYPSHRRRFNWSEVGKTLADPKSYITAFMFFSCNVAFSSMPVFLPTILQDMGYSSVNSQALSAPPYLVAFIIVLITAYLSDRSRSRSPYLIAHALISATAYLAIALTGHFHQSLPPRIHTSIRYLCVYPATSGFFSAITLIITWSMDNRVAKEGKGASVAILNIIGQCGPLLGTRLYPATDGPWYVRGMAVCAVFMGVVAGLAVALRITLQQANARQMGTESDGTDREREVLILGSGAGTKEESFTYII